MTWLQKEIHSYDIFETGSFFGILELLDSLIEAKQSLPVSIILLQLVL